MADESAPGHVRRIDRVLAEDHAATVRSLPMQELRDVREDAEHEEADLSYLRRLLQGRIDLVNAEIDRRRRVAAGETDVPSLLSDLPRILADGPRPPARGLGRHAVVAPEEPSEHRRRVEQLAGDLDLTNIGSCSDDALQTTLTTLEEAEAEVSTRRKQVHAVLDAFAAEITRRYRDGEADVAALLSEHPPA